MCKRVWVTRGYNPGRYVQVRRRCIIIIFGVSTDLELRLKLCLRVLYYVIRLHVANEYQIFIIYNTYTRQLVLYIIYKIVGLDEKPVCYIPQGVRRRSSIYFVYIT